MEVNGSMAWHQKNAMSSATCSQNIVRAVSLLDSSIRTEVFEFMLKNADIEN